MTDNKQKDIMLSEKSDNPIVNYIINTTPKTVRESSYDPNSLYNPYNPSDLFQKRGDYSILEEMLNDDQVFITSQLKKDLVLGSGSKIVVKEDDNNGIVSFLENAIFSFPETDFYQMLEEIVSAYDFGFSISEKVFRKTPNNKLVLKNILTRHPNTWLIHQDIQGKITKYEQQGDKRSLIINPKSLMHYINMGKFQNPYGTTDLRPAYAAYFIKKQIIRYYAIYLEKAASPIPVAKYQAGTPPEEVTNIFNTIKRFQSKTALAIPKNFELDFLQSSGSGEAYIKGINLFNMFIGRSLFIPDLLGFQGAETSGGSFSLGKNQMDVFFNHISSRKRRLESFINYHIIKPLVYYNFGEIEDCPVWRLNTVDEDDVLGYIDRWLQIVKLPRYNPTDEEVNHFKKLINFPESKESQFSPVQSNPETPFNEKLNIPVDEVDNDLNFVGQKKKQTFAVKNEGYNIPEGDYHKKVDFKLVEKIMDDTEGTILDEGTTVINFIFEDLYDQILKKKIISNKRVDRIDSIKLRKLKDLNLILKKNFKDLWVKSQKQAGGEIDKKDFANESTVLTSKEFLDILERESFDYVGDWEYTVTRDARQEMINAIKDGDKIESVVDIIDSKTKVAALESLKRYSRTKTTEIFNKGRLAFFDDSGIVVGYQVSAIMDGVTTLICSSLHGKKFKAGEQPIPPLHWNCRTILIPITKFEEFEPDEKIGATPIEKFIDQNLGKGFSKQ